MWYCWHEVVGFRGPDCERDVVVPLGATVEWMNGYRGATVTSTSVPEGGRAFDSGPLAPTETFRFTPGVLGDWTYVDQFSDSTATLTVGDPAALARR